MAVSGVAVSAAELAAPVKIDRPLKRHPFTGAAVQDGAAGKLEKANPTPLAQRRSRCIPGSCRWRRQVPLGVEGELAGQWRLLYFAIVSPSGTKLSRESYGWRLSLPHCADGPESGGAGGGEEASEQADGHREDHPCHDEPRAELEVSEELGTGVA